MNKKKEKENESAIVLCSHGSNDIELHKNLKDLTNKIKKSFPDKKIFLCFIEINYPSIEECLKKILNSFERIIFLPLLVINGNHFQIDILSKLNSFEKKLRKKIYLTETIQMDSELVSIYSNILSPTIKENRLKVFITVTSKTKNELAKKKINNFISKLSKKLLLDNCLYYEYGNEDKAFRKLITILKQKKPTQIFLNPIFLFNGFLYKETVKRFKSKFKNRIVTIKPLIKQPEIIELLKKKINSKILL